MAQINLLGSEHGSGFKKNGYSWVAKGMGVLLVLLALVYIYLYFNHNSLQKRVNDYRKKTIAAQNEASNNVAREELLTRQGQLASLNPLIEDHVYWSSLLPELARVSLLQSNYTAITAAANGSLTLSVEMPTYADLDKFLQVFDNPDFNKQFSDVRILSINKAIEEGQISYVMRVQLSFEPKVIKNPNP